MGVAQTWEGPKHESIDDETIARLLHFPPTWDGWMGGGQNLKGVGCVRDVGLVVQKNSTCFLDNTL